MRAFKITTKVSDYPFIVVADGTYEALAKLYTGEEWKISDEQIDSIEAFDVPSDHVIV